jgi:hypothetical protein
MPIDIVAVDANPVVWAVFCEECNAYIGERTIDGAMADKVALKHLKEVHPIEEPSNNPSR